MENTCLIVLGNKEVREKERDAAQELYNFLILLMQGLGYKVKIKEPNEGNNTKDLIQDASVVIAHSQGASRILKHFSNKEFRNIKQLILLDPKIEYLTSWTKIETNKLCILSREEKRFIEKDIFRIEDNHFFTDSKYKIGILIKSLLIE
jgi:hypothetical protein